MLIMIRVHIAINSLLNVDKLPNMQAGAIEKVNITSNQADVGASLVVGNARRVDDGGPGNECRDLAEIILDHQRTVACSRAWRCASSNRYVLISPAHSMKSRLSATSIASKRRSNSSEEKPYCCSKPRNRSLVRCNASSSMRNSARTADSISGLSGVEPSVVTVICWLMKSVLQVLLCPDCITGLRQRQRTPRVDEA